MPMFTFYLCQEDGAAASFEAFELVDETEAPARANRMLAAHPSCSYVNVWRVETKVLTLHRDEAPDVPRPTTFRRTPDLHRA
jgi:hypothetical protein